MEKSKIILSRDCLPYYLCQIEKNRYSRHKKKQKFLNIMMNAGKETCAFIFNKHFWIAKKMQSILVNSKFPLLSIKSINNNKTKHNLRSNLKKTRAAANKNSKVQGTRNKLFLAKMNSTHMLEIYLKISMKGTYLDYAQQTVSVTTLVSKYHFLKILGKRSLCLCKSA